MNENINLCKILKGHEGELFYSNTFGYVRIDFIDYPCITVVSDKDLTSYRIESNGLYTGDGELCIFPSKEQRDWDKWVEEQNSRVPKTWSELSNNLTSRINAIRDVVDYGVSDKHTPIEKSALALLKIHQLIEVGYGGNACPTHERFYTIAYDFTDGEFCVRENEHFIVSDLILIGFHTAEQAEEFLSYPENVQLLKDYFMI